MKEFTEITKENFEEAKETLEQLFEMPNFENDEKLQEQFDLLETLLSTYLNKEKKMEINKKLELDESDLGQLHDVILDVFEVNVTNEQIKKLIGLCKNWDGETDTLGRSDFINEICNHFVGMGVPMYGSDIAYKENFWTAIEHKKETFLKFIS